MNSGSATYVQIALEAGKQSLAFRSSMLFFNFVGGVSTVHHLFTLVATSLTRRAGSLGALEPWAGRVVLARIQLVATFLHVRLETVLYVLQRSLS